MDSFYIIHRQFVAVIYHSGGCVEPVISSFLLCFVFFFLFDKFSGSCSPIDSKLPYLKYYMENGKSTYYKAYDPYRNRKDQNDNQNTKRH